MAKLTPQEFQSKHQTRLTAAISDIKKGIDRVTESPTVKAANSQDKMRANLLASIDNGKWASGLKRVSLDDWKKKARDVGADRIAAGIAAAKDKVVAFAEQLLPYIDSVKTEVDKMPSITLEDNIARMTAFVRKMAQFTRK